MKQAEKPPEKQESHVTLPDYLDVETNVLGDWIGYVALLDEMGDEYTPAEDARTSTGKGRLGPQKDAALQSRLMRDNHTSPFEGVLLKFEIMAPLFTLRELDRHRTTTKVADGDEMELEIVTPEEAGRKWFARNEMSGRYVELPGLYYFPKVVRKQATGNMQGTSSAGAVDDELAHWFWPEAEDVVRRARLLYEKAVEHGIEKGVARIANTQNQYTKIRLTGSLKNFLDLLHLRDADGVQWECRQVAVGLMRILQRRYEAILADWREQHHEAVRLTKTESLVFSSFITAMLESRSAADAVRAIGSMMEAPSAVSALKKLGVRA